MASYLILYSTTDGHTLKIARFLGAQLSSHDRQNDILDIEDAEKVDLNPYDGVLIAASIRYGKFAKPVRDYVNSHAMTLQGKRTAFLSVNLVARKPEKNSPETNVYTRKFLRKIKWRPDMVHVAAGMLDYPKYGFWDRNIIRLIMKMTGGPTDMKTSMEFTDWARVAEFGKRFEEL